MLSKFFRKYNLLYNFSYTINLSITDFEREMLKHIDKDSLIMMSALWSDNLLYGTFSEGEFELFKRRQFFKSSPFWIKCSGTYEEVDGGTKIQGKVDAFPSWTLFFSIVGSIFWLTILSNYLINFDLDQVMGSIIFFLLTLIFFIVLPIYTGRLGLKSVVKELDSVFRRMNENFPND
ncbi:MAG: hypothetical protein ACI80H_001084 [Pseudoalteromonas distincta]|jgi:hypothetical protein